MGRNTSIFWRVGEPTKKAWVDFCKARGTDQNFAGDKLVVWFLSLPPLLQSMVLHQSPNDPELREYVARELMKRKPGRRRRTP